MRDDDVWLPNAIAPMTTANATSDAATSTLGGRAVREMPRRSAPASPTTAASPAARRPHSEPGSTYAPNVIAIAAHDAVFPTTNPKPAKKPHHSPRRSRP